MSPERMFGRLHRGAACGPVIGTSAQLTPDLAVVRNRAVCPATREAAAERVLGLVAKGDLAEDAATPALFAIALGLPETSAPYRTALTLMRAHMSAAQSTAGLLPDLHLRRPHILG